MPSERTNKGQLMLTFVLFNTMTPCYRPTVDYRALVLALSRTVEQWILCIQ